MGTLSYTATVSLDGYAADADGGFAWTGPSDDVFRFHVERLGAVTAEVLGRRTYQLMTYWYTEPADGAWGAHEHEFARLVPGLDLTELQAIVDASPGEVEVFGPTTAAPAIRAGMVRDYRFFVVPRVVGGGLSALPDGASLDLDLVEHREFGGGIVYLHYVGRR